MFRMKKRTQLNLTSLTNKYNVGAVFLLFVIQPTRKHDSIERMKDWQICVRDNRLETTKKEEEVEIEKKTQQRNHRHKYT